MVKFEFNLSHSSITNLIKQLQDYGKSFEEAKMDILQALIDYAYERIMFYVPVDTGQLMDSFVTEVSEEMGRVYTDLYYAKYVEFGTGVRGQNSDYDPEYKSQLVFDNQYAGQEAQKYMYRALQDLEANYIEIAKGVLKEKGLL